VYLASVRRLCESELSILFAMSTRPVLLINCTLRYIITIFVTLWCTHARPNTGAQYLNVLWSAYRSNRSPGYVHERLVAKSVSARRTEA
jgi:hypothetical protein